MNESIFTEEEYSSERLEFYSPKRPKPGISLREQEFTEIRGRNYLLSPQKSPVKQKPMPINKQATQSILLEINEEPGLDSRKEDVKTRGSKVTKKAKRNLHIDSTKLHTARSDIDKKTDRKARRERLGHTVHNTDDVHVHVARNCHPNDLITANMYVYSVIGITESEETRGRAID